MVLSTIYEGSGDKMVVAKAPHWSLRQVKKALKGGGLELTKARAIDHLLRHESSVVDRRTAVAFVRPIIDGLKGTDFSHTVNAMHNISDVYGVQINGRDWWVKVTLEDKPVVQAKSSGKAKGKKTVIKHVSVISFHPPEREFKTVFFASLRSN